MKKLLLSFSVLFLSIQYFSANGQDISKNPAVKMLKHSKYKLLFEDDFNLIGTPSSDDWLLRDNAKMGGISAPVNVIQDEVEGAIGLQIKFTTDSSLAIEERFIGGGIVSTHNFGYGYYEARVKLYGGHKGLSGLHQSFWSMGLTGTNEAEGEGVRDSLVNIDAFPKENRVLEIDGFEHNSKDNTLSQNYHVYAPKHISKYPDPKSFSKDLSDWIIVGYEWLPNRINIYADGVHISTRELNGAWRVYAPQNVWFTALPVNLEAWGGIVPPPDGAAMQVDYFRFYAKKLKQVNRIGNPGFEYGKPGNVYPIAWIVSRTEGNNPGAVKVVDLNTTAYAGSRYLMHQFDKPYKATTKQIIEFIPDGKYTFSAYVKSSGGQSKAICLVKTGGKTHDVKIDAADFWTKVSIEGIKVRNNKATVEIHSEGDAEQWLMVDSVTFSED